eukprot:scaffold19797_cov24-Tisochrysis_lutea.AAC.1
MRGAARAMVAYARRLRAEGPPGSATVAEALTAYGVLLIQEIHVRMVMGKRSKLQWIAWSATKTRSQAEHGESAQQAVKIELPITL